MVPKLFKTLLWAVQVFCLKYKSFQGITTKLSKATLLRQQGGGEKNHCCPSFPPFNPFFTGRKSELITQAPGCSFQVAAIPQPYERSEMKTGIDCCLAAALDRAIV